jgi:hypothetical protein
MTTKRKKIVLGALVLGLAVVACPFARDRAANDLRLWRLKRSFRQMPQNERGSGLLMRRGQTNTLPGRAAEYA